MARSSPNNSGSVPGPKDLHSSFFHPGSPVQALAETLARPVKDWPKSLANEVYGIIKASVSSPEDLREIEDRYDPEDADNQTTKNYMCLSPGDFGWTNELDIATAIQTNNVVTVDEYDPIDNKDRTRAVAQLPTILPTALPSSFYLTRTLRKFDEVQTASYLVMPQKLARAFSMLPPNQRSKMLNAQFLEIPIQQFSGMPLTNLFTASGWAFEIQPFVRLFPIKVSRNFNFDLSVTVPIQIHYLDASQNAVQDARNSHAHDIYLAELEGHKSLLALFQLHHNVGWQEPAFLNRYPETATINPEVTEAASSGVSQLPTLPEQMPLHISSDYKVITIYSDRFVLTKGVLNIFRLLLRDAIGGGSGLQADVKLTDATSYGDLCKTCKDFKSLVKSDPKTRPPIFKLQDIVTTALSETLYLKPDWKPPLGNPRDDF
jgi:hypothetical protein